MSKNITSKALLLFSISFLVISFSLMTWYIFVGYRPFFDSDAAAKVLLAKEISRTGEYFPRDWVYVNNDLWVVFGHSLIVPLLAYSSAGFFVHAVAGWIVSIITLISVYAITDKLTQSIPKRLMVTSIISGGISSYVAEFMYGQAAYSPIFIFACVSLLLAWRILNNKKSLSRRSKILNCSFLFLLFLVLFWSNPQRAIVFYVAPLIISASVFSLKRSNRSSFKTLSFVLFSVILGSFLGIILHKYTLIFTNMDVGVVRITLQDGDSIWFKFGSVVKELFKLTGGLPDRSVLLQSSNGMFFLYNILMALFILCLFVCVITTKSASNDFFRFITNYIVAGFLLIVFFQTFTDLTVRFYYFIPVFILIMISIMSFPFNFRMAPIRSALQIVFIFMCLAGPLVSYLYPFTYMDDKAFRRRLPSDGILKILKDNNLTFGYASYWNAGVLTVLSNEKVIIRAIDFGGGLPMPYRWLSSNYWYQPSTFIGRSFLLLDQSEVSKVDWFEMNKLGLQVKDIFQYTLNDTKYFIYVFEKNIASAIPGWDIRVESPIYFQADTSARHEIGALIDPNGDGKLILYSKKGEKGFLHFGPYLLVGSGRYEVAFNVKGSSDSAPSFRVFVTSAPGGEVLAERGYVNHDGEVDLDIKINGMRLLEFKVWSSGEGTVEFSGVSIRRLKDG